MDLEPSSEPVDRLMTWLTTALRGAYWSKFIWQHFAEILHLGDGVVAFIMNVLLIISMLNCGTGFCSSPQCWRFHFRWCWWCGGVRMLCAGSPGWCRVCCFGLSTIKGTCPEVNDPPLSDGVDGLVHWVLPLPTFCVTKRTPRLTSLAVMKLWCPFCIKLILMIISNNNKMVYSHKNWWLVYWPASIISSWLHQSISRHQGVEAQ